MPTPYIVAFFASMLILIIHHNILNIKAEKSNYVSNYLHEILNKWVLGEDLKDSTIAHSRMSDGRWLHSLGPATLKA